MSNYKPHTMALASILATLPQVSNADQTNETLKFSFGIGYTQTPSGDIDDFAEKEVSTYEASMPGTISFVDINHNLPLLSLGIEYKLNQQLSIITNLSGMSSYLLGNLTDNRTVNAKTEQIDFGDTDQTWKQHLNLFAKGELEARIYNSPFEHKPRVFAEGGLAVSYLNADSTFSFHVQKENYLKDGVLTWEILNQLGAFRDMTSNAKTTGTSLGPDIKVGIAIPFISRTYGIITAGVTYFIGDLDVTIDTKYPGALPKTDKSEVRHKTIDNSGLVPHIELKVQF